MKSNLCRRSNTTILERIKANEVGSSATGSAEGTNVEFGRIYLSLPRQSTASGSDEVVRHQRRRHGWENHHIASLSCPLLYSYNPINLVIRGNIYIQRHTLGWESYSPLPEESKRC